MAQLGITLDIDTIEPAQNGFDNIPNGEYVAHITENEVANTKAGTGVMLKLTWEILEGEYERRKIWQQINYQHENPTTQKIGQGQIKNICEAVGYGGHLDDGDVLMHVPCRIKVGLSKPKDGYEPRNEVKSVKPYAAQAPAGKAPVQTIKPKPNTELKASGSVANFAAPTGPRPWQTKPAA